MEQVNCLEKQCLYLQGSWIFSNAIESAGFNVCVPSTKPYNQSLIEYQLFTQYNRSHFVFYHLFGFISVCFGVITVIYPECLCYKIRVCKYLYQHIDTFFHCRDQGSFGLSTGGPDLQGSLQPEEFITCLALFLFVLELSRLFTQNVYVIK